MLESMQGACLHWPQPVSYTHLDVYKRQVVGEAIHVCIPDIAATEVRKSVGPIKDPVDSEGIRLEENDLLMNDGKNFLLEDDNRRPKDRILVFDSCLLYTSV